MVIFEGPDQLGELLTFHRGLHQMYISLVRKGKYTSSFANFSLHQGNLEVAKL